mmetsp:Transcript_39113/g.59664  ORF Transcript_39113/g.59664 Transcript_39113/m.59664 type:complete len:81 (+) Transcript_39113:1364-1606(+)
MDRVQTKLEACKKLGIKVATEHKDAAVKQDLSEHFQAESFEKVIERVKELSEESFMRKLNASKASKALKNYFKETGDTQI